MGVSFGVWFVLFWGVFFLGVFCLFVLFWGSGGGGVDF